MDTVISRLVMSENLFGSMRTHVKGAAPQEACGLVAGRQQGEKGTSLSVLPITNILNSATRYRMDPTEQMRAFLLLERLGWELLAIYHSHPKGPDRPSPTDIAEAYYPEQLYLILDGRNDEWQCKGYQIRSGHVRRVDLEIP